MYLFLDLEASGLRPRFDAPLQATFVQCDANLAVQRELTLRYRLPDHIVPAPDAHSKDWIRSTRLHHHTVIRLFEQPQVCDRGECRLPR